MLPELEAISEKRSPVLLWLIMPLTVNLTGFKWLDQTNTQRSIYFCSSEEGSTGQIWPVGHSLEAPNQC